MLATEGGTQSLKPLQANYFNETMVRIGLARDVPTIATKGLDQKPRRFIANCICNLAKGMGKGDGGIVPVGHSRNYGPKINGHDPRKCSGGDARWRIIGRDRASG